MRENLIELIIQITRDMAEVEDLELPGELTADTRLFGDEGILDSMGLVSLVVEVEQAIEDKFGASVALADDKALSQRRSPYRSIDSLASYALEQMEANATQ